MAVTENLEMGAFAQERLNLEREALAVERERLAAARAHAEAEAKLYHSQPRHFRLALVAVVLFGLLAFAGGVFTGVSISEGKIARARDARLREALSGLDDISRVTVTNSAGGVQSGMEARRNVSVLVFQ